MNEISLNFTSVLTALHFKNRYPHRVSGGRQLKADMDHFLKTYSLKQENAPFAISELANIFWAENVVIKIISSNLKKVVASFPENPRFDKYVIWGVDSVSNFQSHLDFTIRPNALLKEKTVFCLFCDLPQNRDNLYSAAHVKSCCCPFPYCTFCLRPIIDQSAKMPSYLLSFVCVKGRFFV